MFTSIKLLPSPFNRVWLCVPLNLIQQTIQSPFSLCVCMCPRSRIDSPPDLEYVYWLKVGFIGYFVESKAFFKLFGFQKFLAHLD